MELELSITSAGCDCPAGGGPVEEVAVLPWVPVTSRRKPGQPAVAEPPWACPARWGKLALLALTGVAPVPGASRCPRTSLVVAVVPVALASEAVMPACPHPQVLIDWVNDVLVEDRIIVKQLEEDLYDGQVLQKLLGEWGAPGTGPPRRAAPGRRPVLHVGVLAPCPQRRRKVAALSPQCPGVSPVLGVRSPVLSPFLRWAFSQSSQPRGCRRSRTASRTICGFGAVGDIPTGSVVMGHALQSGLVAENKTGR